MTLSLLTIKDVGYEKKVEEIKNAYPKKVCNMLKRHVRKKIKRKEKKDAHPKKVCHMPTRHVKKKKKEKDSPHPWKIKKREGSCKGVHPPKKNSHTLTHLDQIV